MTGRLVGYVCAGPVRQAEAIDVVVETFTDDVSGGSRGLRTAGATMLGRARGGDIVGALLLVERCRCRCDTLHGHPRRR